MELYTINALSKYYERWNVRLRKKSEVFVMRNLNLTINEKEFVCIIGKSGVGKTTLLKMLGGIEKPSTGSIFYTNIELYQCSEIKMEEYRRKEIGFIFQDYKLMDEMTVRENILIPQILDGVEREVAEKKWRKSQICLVLMKKRIFIHMNCLEEKSNELQFAEL